MTTEEKELEIIALTMKVSKLNRDNRTLSSALIQVQEEKAHNEQLLDAFQNTLADFGYKLVDIND